MHNLTPIIIAILPIIAIGLFLISLHKNYTQTLYVLILCFFAGTIICAPVFFIEKALQLEIQPFDFKKIGSLFNAFLIVALTEESLKFIALIFIAFRSNLLKTIRDGISFAIMTSLGFAFIENIMYVRDADTIFAIQRAIFAIPAHLVLGILMGFFLGKAKFAKHKYLYLFLSFFCPFLFHGTYNFCLYLGYPYLLIPILSGIFILYFIPLKANYFHTFKE